MNKSAFREPMRDKKEIRKNEKHNPRYVEEMNAATRMLEKGMDIEEVIKRIKIKYNTSDEVLFKTIRKTAELMKTASISGELVKIAMELEKSITSRIATRGRATSSVRLKDIYDLDDDKIVDELDALIGEAKYEVELFFTANWSTQKDDNNRDYMQIDDMELEEGDLVLNGRTRIKLQPRILKYLENVKEIEEMAYENMGDVGND